MEIAMGPFWPEDWSVPLVDNLFAVGWLRKAIWRLWYPFLTRQLRNEAVVFLNYAFEEEPAMGIPLPPGQEPNRACIQLYHHVASQVPLHGKEILEVLWSRRWSGLCLA